jgi:hypothetical protein
MTLRSAGFVTDPITGPRSFGSAAPQRIGRRATPPLGSGCEVSRIWVERFAVLMQKNSTPEIDKALQSRCPESLNVTRRESGAKAPDRQLALGF